jgi:hypothetical protein
MSTTPTLEENEVAIEEVRCSVTGMPIPSIPPWYANVKVNFVSEQGRKKNATEHGLPVDIVIETDPESTLDRPVIDYEDIEMEDDVEMEDLGVMEGDADTDLEIGVEADVPLEEESVEVI